MDSGNRTHERLLALFMLGVLLLLPPLLLIFNRPARILGIPALYLYIFSAWALVIALAAAIARRIPAGQEAPADERPAAEESAGALTARRDA